MAVSMKSASVKAFGATPKAARSVVVRSEHKPREPVRFEDIPASQRVFTDAQWDEAINKASTGKYAATISASTSTPAAAAPAAAKVVTVGDAFAFSGPLPETANGRLAMLGFVAALGAEVASGKTTLAQFGDAPAAIIATAVIFSLASLAPVLKGANPNEAFGPLTPAAEKLNGRAAMIGLAAMLVIELTQGKPLITF